jgi:DNA polymerase-3 subunit gamma/tau
MKLSAAILAASVATAAAFAPKGALRTSTELNNWAPGGPGKPSYAPTKWSPRTGGGVPGGWAPPASNGAAASAYAPPAPAAAPAAPSGPSMADLATAWAATNSDKDTRYGTAPKAAAPVSAPPAAAPPAASFAASGSGPKKSYATTKWSPKGGANPYRDASANGGFAPAPVAAAPAQAYAAPAAAAPPMSDLAAQWANMNKTK